MRTAALVSSIAAFALSVGSASAATYSNTSQYNDFSHVYFGFGAPDNLYSGEIFTAPGGSLSSWWFAMAAHNPGNVELVIAKWDGTQTVGPALYTSAPLDANTDTSGYADNPVGFEWIGTGGIDTALTKGQQYVALFSFSGFADPLPSGNGTPNQNDIAYLGSPAEPDPFAQGLVFLNDDSPAWHNEGPGELVYKATFTAVTPIPATLPLLASALGGLGFVGLRRKRAAA